MNRFFVTFRTAAILVVGGIAAALLFAVLGSLLVALGLFAIVAAVAGGLHFLIFGRGRVAPVQRSPDGYDMIDITPPRPPRHKR
ncbi:hypothetical protein EDC64_12131 [Aquabacter spiritensis]|uniref:Uncharacterized protein n=2 Tax=Aquabacter spiritensis TaxID=933073 RepID=A0A4R3LL19_9HYPH|nr:hypothetical protein EDC64_12131 [Aquabacter spiritensis]